MGACLEALVEALEPGGVSASPAGQLIIQQGLSCSRGLQNALCHQLRKVARIVGSQSPQHCACRLLHLCEGRLS